MEISVRYGRGKILTITANKDDTEQYLRNIIIKKIPHSDEYFHNIKLSFNGKIMKYFKKLYEYDLKEKNIIMIIPSGTPTGGYIDNLKEESETPIAKKIGFDMNLLKRDELKINLIHYDSNMTNKENYGYFNKFKLTLSEDFMQWMIKIYS